jgi:signal transduction histidine kinase/CheY-like chemotaxis protein
MPAQGSSGLSPEASAPYFRRAGLAIPGLAIVIVCLWIAKMHRVWPCPPLFWLLAYGPAILAVLGIALPTARAFARHGQPGVLMLGCGMWVNALGVVGGALGASHGLDQNWAIYNVANLLSACCHLAGLSLSVRPRVPPADIGAWLAATYGGSLAAVALLAWAACAGHLPAFYVPGQGSSPLRSVVVLATVILFGVVARRLHLTQRRTESRFQAWYALGLGLIATGLAGSILIAAADSPLQWVTRVSRSWGTLYLFLAVRAERHARGDGGIALEAVPAPPRPRLRDLTLRYGAAPLAVGLAFLAHLAFTAGFGPVTPYLAFCPAMLAVAALAGLGPGLLATGLTAALLSFGVLSPIGHFAVAAPVDRLELVVFSSLGVLMSVLAGLYHSARAEAAAGAEHQRLEQLLQEEARRKDAFLALLGHELRNPLAPIGNAVHLLRRGGLDPAVAEQLCAMMERQVAHMSRLLDDLLDLSRIRSGKIQLRTEPLDLGETVVRLLADYRPVLAERGLALAALQVAEPIRILADRARIVQAVSNLLHNAMKFTDPGGRVVVAVEAAEPGWCQVRVRDNGQGIRPGRLDSVFEPFVQEPGTLDRSPSGLGLGLALVRDLAALHGGTATAQSEGPGHGTEIILRLPTLPATARPASPAPAAPAAPPFRPRRVLIVEDLEDSALTLQMLLRMLGHTTEVAGDGGSALAAAERFRPDVVLCDLGLPGGLDGYEVARRLRSSPQLATAHLVALSGFGTPEDKAQAAQAGFERHLTKPVAPASLGPLIASLD